MKDQLITKTIRLKKDLVSAIEERAFEENRNFSNMVETILLDYIHTHGPDPFIKGVKNIVNRVLLKDNGF